MCRGWKKIIIILQQIQMHTNCIWSDCTHLYYTLNVNLTIQYKGSNVQSSAFNDQIEFDLQETFGY